MKKENITTTIPNRRPRSLLFIIFSFLFSSVAAQDSLLLRDYHFVQQADPWLTAPNAAALTRFATRNIVEASASLTKGRGGHVNYYDSSNTLQGNVSIESYYRLSPRAVAYGAISYDNWSGEDMTGSAFIQPTRKPFDIVEDSLTNAGDKHRDTYHLSGGIGYDIANGIAVGARLDYTSANYAKYKDLRHKNKLMDLVFTLGAYAPLAEWVAVGADYAYHRNTESLDFGTYGKSEKIYKSLISYGAMMGRVEQFGNEGYTDKSREMPLFEDSHGGSFQLELRPLQPLSIYGDFGFSHGTGYYGRRSPYTITLTNHKRDIVESRVRVIYQTGTSRFHLDASYADEKLKNNAETWRELTNASGSNYYEYYDAVETADKRWKDADMAFTTHLDIRNELPTWSFSAAYRWREQNISAYLYPFYRHQLLSSSEVALSATRNLVCSKGVWTFCVHGSFLKGTGDPFNDGSFVTPSAKQEQPATMDAFLWREYQYLTAPQYSIGGSVQYAFLLPGTRVKTYARFSGSHRKANATYQYSTGCDRTYLSLAIGCSF